MILVVDDSVPQARALSLLLKNAGYPAPLLAHAAAEVWPHLAAPAAAIDLVLLDLHMPEVNGIELCRRIKAQPRWADLPIIMVTSSLAVDDLQQAFDVGAMDYITKPPNSIELLARVRSALRLKQEMDSRKAREQELLALSQQLTEKNHQLTEMNDAMEKMFDSLAAHHRELQVEQDRSERLLLNILPQPIAARLKTESGVIADVFPTVTVLFADIVDFTPLSARTAPRELVALLNRVFSVFDRLAEQHGLEKIKTIGDAYMAVGGLPAPHPDPTAAVADMALTMLQEFGGQRSATGNLLRLRIGIHTGSVVAGVIGTKKFSYDLWGDTVNTASRMEATALPGQIQVTQAVYEILAPRYHLEPRGAIDVKGKGAMLTYWLRGRRL